MHSDTIIYEEIQHGTHVLCSEKHILQRSISWHCQVVSLSYQPTCWFIPGPIYGGIGACQVNSINIWENNGSLITLIINYEHLPCDAANVDSMQITSNIL